MMMGMQPQPLRIPGGDWRKSREINGRKAPEAVRQFIAWSLHRPGAELPARPPAGAPPVPDEVISAFVAWYLRQPGAELPRRPGGETQAQLIRIPGEDWRGVRAMHRPEAPQAVRQFIAWSLHRPGAELPARPAEG